ncbi:proteasome subunit beta type-2 [Drosophila ficusphila]|uniref:proteasome subunit beta type-2 n=1 Tax=Drosophila ficusphila TaxID=30025 RepID=UPI0007E7C67A|nr:proteasome subunit beta type-2 [Drosophila ficusphila]XP_017053769.1 proteasome subunit beta type-2 [Drosophila ficusphila]
MLAEESSSSEGSMVGLMCVDGVILATNSREHALYHLDERIYCCAPRSGLNRDLILSVGAVVDYQSRVWGFKLMVAQVRDILCRKYEDVESVDVIIAGQDDKGLHVFSLKPHGKWKNVIYTAKGKEANNIITFLAKNWNVQLKLQKAEKLALKSLNLKENDYRDVCVIYKVVNSRIEEEPHMEVDPVNVDPVADLESESD